MAIRSVSGHPRRGRALALVGLAVAGGLTGCAGGSSKPTDTSVPALQDVTLTSCAPSDDPSEGYLARFSVTNHGAQTSDYVVTVAFLGPDRGQEVDRAAVALARVDPGQTADDETSSSNADLRSVAGITCKVDSAMRSVAG